VRGRGAMDIAARAGPVWRGLWLLGLRVAAWPLRRLAEARGRLFPCAVVCLAIGIGCWFLLPFEPGAALYFGIGLSCLLALALGLRGPDLMQPLALAAFWLLLGPLACGLRTHSVAAPMLDHPYYGAVTGRVVGIDRSQSDTLRLTLDRVVLERYRPERLPQRVRISLRGKAPRQAPLPGQVVMTTAYLSAPQGPAEPGGFNFRRMAFFDRLGAVGYTATPVVLWAEAGHGTQIIDRLRGAISRALLAAMPGQAGAFATGAMTGDRSAINAASAQDLRDSSLAHLLAISGMNMAFLVAFVFALIRNGLALMPWLALRLDGKKLAALVSLAVGLFYLLLSGANVATQRAFLMVVVMLVAILIDRRALTLGSVAISGLILLLWQPESLLEAGFQMSFAATVALICGLGAANRRMVGARLPRWAMPPVVAILSSALGGLATAPYVAAHFNRFADLGFFANLLTAPVMGLMIMPGGVMAALLWPLGLAAPALWLMHQGAAWILYIAHRIAAIEGAVTAIAAPDRWVIPVLSLSFAWAVLVGGRWRLLGLLPAGLSLSLWLLSPADRPDLLISADGKLVGLLGPRGRALSVARGGGFSAANWLARDGDLAGQVAAAARPGFSGPRSARSFDLGGWRAVALSGKSAAQNLSAACAAYDLVITSAVAARPLIDEPPKNTALRTDSARDPPRRCLLIDALMLRETGAVAFDLREGRLNMLRSHEAARQWMTGISAVGGRSMPIR
jgi:competence protein ComEC